MAQRNSASQILAAQRKQRCWELRQQHYTMQQIADNLGISLQRVSKILSRCIEEQDAQVLAAKDQYRKFLLTEAETTEKRLYQTLSLVPISDFTTRMKVEEQIRKNMELRAKLTAADKAPAVVIAAPEVAAAPDLATIAARAQAWRATLAPAPTPSPAQEGGSGSV